MSINHGTSGVGQRLRCSFCGKGQDEVAKFIAGPKVFICNECVAVCIAIIADDQQANQANSAESERWLARAAALPGNSATCSLCGKSTSLTEMLPIHERGVLCGECADAIEDVIAQGKPIP